MTTAKPMRVLVVVCSIAAAIATPRLGFAQAPSPPAPTADHQADDFAKREGRTHFERGVESFVQGAYEPALAEFRLSIELFPTRAAVTNASLCLQRLGRVDEALSLLETIPGRFGPLSAEEQREFDNVVAELSPQVGLVELRGAKPGTRIAIDERIRGTTPLSTHLYATKGTHRLRLDEVPPVETTIEVVPGERTIVDMAAISRASDAASGRVPGERGATSPPVGEPKDPRITLGVELGAAFASLGGDVAGCPRGCSSGIGWGPRALARLTYHVDRQWALSIEGQYLRLGQHTKARPTYLHTGNGGEEPGSASDNLSLAGGAVGASAHYRPPRFDAMSIRLGIGAFFGSLEDERTFAATASPQDSLSRTQGVPARYAYAAIGADVGYRPAPAWRLGLAVDVIAMVALKQPMWDATADKIILMAGQSQFDRDGALASKLIVVVCPAVLLQYDF